MDFNDSKLTNIEPITVNRSPSSIKEVSIKNYVDDSLGQGTMSKLNQTLENYLKVSVGNYTYNLTKYDKIQITDLTEIKFPNRGIDLLQKWYIKGNNDNNFSKNGKFLKSTITNSPTSFLGATSVPPSGSEFL